MNDRKCTMLHKSLLAALYVPVSCVKSIMIRYAVKQKRGQPTLMNLITSNMRGYLGDRRTVQNATAVC